MPLGDRLGTGFPMPCQLLNGLRAAQMFPGMTPLLLFQGDPHFDNFIFEFMIAIFPGRDTVVTGDTIID